MQDQKVTPEVKATTKKRITVELLLEVGLITSKRHVELKTSSLKKEDIAILARRKYTSIINNGGKVTVQNVTEH